jgi:hypothetical protein
MHGEEDTMAEETTVLEGTVQWMELVDEQDQPMGIAVLIDKQDVLSLLSELDGRRVRITVEVLGALAG